MSTINFTRVSDGQYKAITNLEPERVKKAIKKAIPGIMETPIKGIDTFLVWHLKTPEKKGKTVNCYSWKGPGMYTLIANFELTIKV